MISSQFTNIAFISYKREDEKWARWLQNILEHYKLPIEIRKNNPNIEFSERPRHVFKDTTDLSGGVLAKAIKDGLDSSKFLIVICSPRAAKSEWVCKEVQDFIDSGREEYIIPFIIDGEPYANNPENECFPEALKTLAGERELLGININENGRDSAAVKVVSRLFELRFDNLWDRFQREQRKRRQYAVAGLVATIMLITGIALWIGQLYHHQSIINTALVAANDSISSAYNKLNLSEKRLAESNVELLETNRLLENERNKVLAANQKILSQRSREFADMAYQYIEEGNLSEAEELINKIVPSDRGLYVYTPQLERAVRRYFNYIESFGIRLVENTETIGSGYSQPSSIINKYGYEPSKIYLDYYEMPDGRETRIILNERKDTLLSISEEFDEEKLSDDGRIFIGCVDDTVSIWNVHKKVCICKAQLDDGCVAIKILKNERFIVLGYENFSIYSYNAENIKLEKRAKILGERIRRNGKVDFPFCYDDMLEILIYQKQDSCLITQSINTGEILAERKIDGEITRVTMSSWTNKPYNYLAFTYTKDQNRDKNLEYKNRLQIVFYPGLDYLFDQSLHCYSTYELMFLNGSYLYARVDSEKASAYKEFIWDTSKSVNSDSKLFNRKKTLYLERSVASQYFDKVLYITDDNSIIYMNKNTEGTFSLCLDKESGGGVDTLMVAELDFSNFQSSASGDVLVYSANNQLYIFDRHSNKKEQITSKDVYYDKVTISPDGSTIAYTLFCDGKKHIIIRNVKSGRTDTIIPDNESVGKIQLNEDGTKLMFTDENYSLYDVDIKTKSCTLLSSTGDYSCCFGYSKTGRYLYQVRRQKSNNVELGEQTYLLVWNADSKDLVMENSMDYSPDVLLFDDSEHHKYIYTHCKYESSIIPFLTFDELIKRWGIIKKSQ